MEVHMLTNSAEQEKFRKLHAELLKNAGQEESAGLGDTIAKMTSAIGIKPCAGCKKRQQWLNEKIPYRGKK